MPRRAVLVWPFPWEIKHTLIFQKPKQTKKKKESLNSRHELTLAPSATPSKSSSVPQDMLQVQVHCGVSPGHTRSTSGASSRFNLPARFPLWMEHTSGDQAGGSRIQGHQNKPHPQEDIWDRQALAESGRSKLRCRVRSSLKTSPTLCHLAGKIFLSKFLPQRMSCGRAYVVIPVPCCTCSLGLRREGRGKDEKSHLTKEPPSPKPPAHG